jgi:tetratricopeptide (TPR) repeat protein
VVSPYFALGVLQAELGCHEAAAKTFGGLAKTNPEDPRAWHGLGGALFHLGECTGALAAYERCKRLLHELSGFQRSSHIVDVIHNIGRVLLELGKTEQAWAELDTLSEKESRDPHILALRGKILLAQKRPSDAASYFEQAMWPNLNGRTQHLSNVCDLADCYLALGRVHEASRVLSQGISSCERDAAFCRKLAEFALHSRDFKKATTFLKKAVNLEPESIQNLAELASIQYFLGEMDEAVLYAERCRDLKPDTALERYYRGLAFYIMGKREVAEEERLQAEKDNIIGSWPDYKDLFDDQSRKTNRRQPLKLEAALSSSWIQRLLHLNDRQLTKHLKLGCLRGKDNNR